MSLVHKIFPERRRGQHKKKSAFVAEVPEIPIKVMSAALTVTTIMTVKMIITLHHRLLLGLDGTMTETILTLRATAGVVA
jgi:transcription initiation factor TFIID subunit TAF12